ncbi:MAG: PepSY domain-containing protein, partial [Pseudomonadota bacterium]
AADPLHFGTWGGEGWMGLIVRIAWFVLGMILFGMSLTGVVIYGARTVDRQRRGRRAAARQSTS